MTNTLITGGNKGLGFVTAQRLIAAGHTVWIGARDAGRGTAAARELGAHFLELDVTDDQSVTAAAATLSQSAGHLDVLINNAGVLGEIGPAEDLSVDIMRDVYEPNVFGVVRVTHAFLPLLQAAIAPSVINVSSGLGSFAFTNDPQRIESTFAFPAYASSKAAVTMLTTQYAKALPDIRFNVVDPGQTATDLTGHQGQTPEQGTDAVVRVATMEASAPTGTFTDRDGDVPW